jgi:hypothetical protein
MPYREFGAPEDVKAAVQGVDRLIIDATEARLSSFSRGCKTAGTLQREKKRHMLKNTVMALPDKCIVFLGRTLSGHNHDYNMWKQELPPELDWFTDINVRVD